MFRKRKLVRIISLFFVVEMILNTVLPFMVHALTSGPTAPEATSFEPVDTTDMVNLATGDFVYNLPLLEVPGPSGGYPLSLSYHAGIMPNEEASWVGLGWTLNPGAINRTVSGYPDDHENAEGIARTYWRGGETRSIDIGAVLGIAGMAAMSAGLSVSYDTYQGFGIGQWTGVNSGLTNSVGLNVAVGISPYGDPYASAGLRAGIGNAENMGLQLGANMGVSTNFNNIGQYAGIGIQATDHRSGIRGSVIDASIATSDNGARGHIAIGGINSQHNSKVGNISTSSLGITLPLPLINLGYKYTRYWVDETEVTQTNGSLYYPATDPGDYRYKAYDTYSLLNPDESGTIDDDTDSDKVLGGTFPDYDFYQVNAQGLSGNIRPYYYTGYIARQSRYNEDENYYDVKHIHLGYNSNKPNFRFVGDFSNHVEYIDQSLNTIYGFTESSNSINYNFVGSFEAGDHEQHGYDVASNKLAGSKHVEYYTNKEIKSGSAKHNGFIDTNATGFTRDDDTKLGGFKITNESGVTYHFGLPAYSHDEYQRSRNKNEDAWNDVLRPEKYAYTWYLTAVTGPDYVDRNNNGLADSPDWGYWVEFDYGLWTDQFYWRNPSEGFNIDIDNEFESFSEGYKDIYYLDAIRTKSHTAIFYKEIRNDGKSAVNDTWSMPHSQTSFEGGHYPRSLRKEGWFPDGGGTYATKSYLDYIERPTSVLKLHKIILLENNDLQTALNKSLGIEYQQDFDYTGFQEYSRVRDRGSYLSDYQKRFFYKPQSGWEIPRPITYNHHLPANVFDIYDYENIGPSIKSKILREIDFGTSYELMPGTPNSYSTNLVNQQQPSTLSSFYLQNLTGKLTLKEIEFKGKGGQSILPPMTFSYNKNPGYSKEAYDIWGFYKSDINTTVLNDNETLARIVSDQSAQQVDSWSLSSIGTSLGATIDIEYESDSYDRVALTDLLSFRIKNFEYLSNNRFKITFHDNMTLYPAFEVGKEASLYLGCLMGSNQFLNVDNCVDPNWHEIYSNLVRFFDYKTNSMVKVIDLPGNSIEVEDALLYEFLNGPKTKKGSFLGMKYNNGTIKNKCDIHYNGWPETFVGGYVGSSKQVNRYGGGLRTASITVNGQTGYSESTRYFYSDGVTSYEPFGVLLPMTVDGFPYGDFYDSDLYRGALYHYNDLISNSREVLAPGVVYGNVYKEEYVGGNKVPGKSKFQFTTFQSDFININSSVSSNYGDGTDGQGQPFSETRIGRVVIKDITNHVGLLKEMTLYDEHDNPISKTSYDYLFDPLNDYDSDLIPYHQQGLISETFAESRIVRRKLNSSEHEYQRYGVVSERRQYPVIQVSQTSNNYRTGVSTTTGNLSFDFFSGAITKALTTDSYGNYYVSETLPAYHKYPGMGLAMEGGANMLTQEAETRVYKVDNATNLNPTGLVSANIQTWSDRVPDLGVVRNEATGRLYRGTGTDKRYQFLEVPLGTFSDGDRIVFEGVNSTYKLVIDQWDASRSVYEVALAFGDLAIGESVNGGARIETPFRKHRSYGFIGDKNLQDDGLYSNTTFLLNQFGAWQYGEEPSSNLWQKNSEITLYDTYSHALEATDVNGNYAATLFDPQHERVIATIANAGYSEFVYNGAEDRVESNAHTGKGSIPSTNGSDKPFKSTIYPKRDQVLNVSVWADRNDASIKYRINGGTTNTATLVSAPKAAGGWYLLRAILPQASAGDMVEVWCDVNNTLTYFDDFRVHPTDATITSYVYNEWGELSHVLDANNIYTMYEYDTLGKLFRVWRESFNHDKDGVLDGKTLVTENSYNYASSHN